MNNSINIVNRLLDAFKRVLVKFRNAGFGIKFVKNMLKISDYFTDKNVSILGKGKVLISFVATIMYFVFAIDIIPEILLGPIGLFDDIFVLIWMIGNINEELEKYKGPKDSHIRDSKNIYKDPNIIYDANYTVKDE